MTVWGMVAAVGEATLSARGRVDQAGLCARAGVGWGEGERETGARSRTAWGCGALCQRVDVGGCDDGGEEEEGEGAVRDDRSERGGQAQSEQWCGGPEEQPAATWCG